MKKPLLLTLAVAGLFLVGTIGFISLLVSSLYSSNDPGVKLDPLANSTVSNSVESTDENVAATAPNDPKIDDDVSEPETSDNQQQQLAITDSEDVNIPSGSNSSQPVDVLQLGDSESGNIGSSPISLEDDFDFEDDAAPTNTDVTLSDIPSKSAAMKLVGKWTAEFRKGLVAKDFSKFHAAAAPEFQNTVSVEQFNSQFQRFFDKNIDLQRTRKFQPVLRHAPMLDAKGALTLTGSYPTSPPTEFEYRFVRTKNKWKPIDVFVNVKSTNSEAVPSLKIINALVTSRTLMFGAAVNDQDFSDFHRNELAAEFRAQYPIAKFAEIFKEFLAERASLNWIKGFDPVFDRAPSLDTDGVLQAEGHFPSEPRVNFRYAFVMENSVWKMMVININVPTVKNEQAKRIPPKRLK